MSTTDMDRDDARADEYDDRMRAEGMAWCDVGVHWVRVEHMADDETCVGCSDGPSACSCGYREPCRRDHDRQDIRDCFSETLDCFSETLDEIGDLSSAGIRDRIEEGMRELLRRLAMRMAIAAAGLDE